jgi:hypothetical protein
VLLPAGVALADSEFVSIHYELQPAFTGADQIGGRIVVTVTNLSGQALANVSLGLADPGVGRVTGSTKERLQLAVGETGTFDGEFLLAADVVRKSRPLDWVIVHDDAQGFARQMRVHGQPLREASAGVAAHPAH